MKVLLFLETNGSEIKRSSLELLSAAQTAKAETSAILLGTGAKAHADELKAWGVTKLYACENEVLDTYNSEIYVSLLSSVVETEKPKVVLASSSALAKDAFPRVAARTNSAFVNDAVDISLADQLSAKQPLYAGKCTATVNFQNADTNIVLMRPNQLPVVDASSSAETQVEEVALPSAPEKVKVVEVQKGESEKLDLTEANAIVSGGRGMKGAEHFQLLEDLAKPINATVGASRAVVDSGWVPHSMQVGQTGKTVAPSLYIAVGISGAIQHLAGMSGSKVIVAINKDADAPIFQKATYGLVGDAFEIVPKLAEEFKALQS